MIYLALAVIFLHFSVLPIVFDVNVSFDSETGRGKVRLRVFMIPVFVKKFGVRLSDVKAGKSDKKDDERELSPYLLRFLYGVLRRLEVRELQLACELGAGDAAVTAVAIGAVKAAFCDACAVLGCRNGGTAGIIPDYDAERVFIDFFGIFSLCFADIIVAVLSAVKLPGIFGAKRRVYGNVTGQE